MTAEPITCPADCACPRMACAAATGNPGAPRSPTCPGAFPDPPEGWKTWKREEVARIRAELERLGNIFRTFAPEKLLDRKD